MDNLFDQFANISKAHGYDILAKRVQELEEENNKLKEILTAWVDYMDSDLSEGEKELKEKSINLI